MSAIARRAFASGLTSFSLVACSAIWGFEDLRLAPSADAGDLGDAREGPNPDAVGNAKASKVDILVVVDDEASMIYARSRVVESVAALVRAAAASGDVHFGILTTSFGGMGGDVCAGGVQRTRAHLLKTAEDDPGFQAFVRDVAIETFVDRAKARFAYVGKKGCGFPAPLESAYRFLSAPDPWASVSVGSDSKAVYVGTDEKLLAERASFLRDDSLVVVLLVTNHEDASLDPLAFGGLGWAFLTSRFPGSTVDRVDTVTSTAPRATSICSTKPSDPDCTSCKCIDPPCAPVGADPSCMLTDGYYGRDEEDLAIRFHRMKQRYGRDPQFPISRYSNALTKQRVPSRSQEHPETGDEEQRRISDYDVSAASCTNPLFAAAPLPTSSAQELCKLPVGPRGKELVLLTVIGGVPRSLVEAGTPGSWEKVVGRDPEAFDTSGIDPHMIQSPAPRDGLPGPGPRGDNDADPDHGREWNTGGRDLQYACTYAFDSPVYCGVSDAACDCATSNVVPPICGAADGEQQKGKAYPSVRPLRVAREVGERATVGSVCSTRASGQTTIDAVAARISSLLTK